MVTRCYKCWVVLEPNTPTVFFNQNLYHHGCYQVVERNLECPYGCGPRNHVGGDSYGCLSDHK